MNGRNIIVIGISLLVPMIPIVTFIVCGQDPPIEVVIHNNSGSNFVIVTNSSRVGIQSGSDAKMHLSSIRSFSIKLVDGLSYNYTVEQGYYCALKLYLQVEPDMGIYLVQCDGDDQTKSIREQPMGFPVMPTKEPGREKQKEEKTKGSE
jgi:hypothetical protein